MSEITEHRWKGSPWAREEALARLRGGECGEWRWLGRGGRCLSITSLFPAKSEAKPLAEHRRDDEEEVWSVSRMSEALTVPHRG